MASIKAFKKDIDFAIAEFSDDCFIAQAVIPREEEEKVEALFTETYSKAVELFQKLKGYDKAKGKEAAKARKQHFSTLRADFTKLMTGASETLYELIEKNSKN